MKIDGLPPTQLLQVPCASCGTLTTLANAASAVELRTHWRCPYCLVEANAAWRASLHDEVRAIALHAGTGVDDRH